MLIVRVPPLSFLNLVILRDEYSSQIISNNVRTMNMILHASRQILLNFLPYSLACGSSAENCSQGIIPCCYLGVAASSRTADRSTLLTIYVANNNRRTFRWFLILLRLLLCCTLTSTIHGINPSNLPCQISYGKRKRKRKEKQRTLAI